MSTVSRTGPSTIGTGPPAPGPTLRGYGRFVRRHRAVLAALAVLGALVGAALTMYWPPVYVAQATVAVATAPTGAEPDLEQPRFVSLDSEALIMSSGAVVSVAAEASSFPGGGAALMERLRVSALPNTRVLVVKVSHPDRALALRACAAVIDEFLRVRGEEVRARADLAISDLETQAEQVTAQLAALRSPADAAQPEDAPAALRPAEEQLLGRLAELSAELRVAALAATTAPSQVVDAPVAPAQGGRPLAAGSVVSGLLIGLGVGVAVASWTAAGRDGPGPWRRTAASPAGAWRRTAASPEGRP